MEQVEVFNLMEQDAIGEIMNISLGSSATALSNMLDRPCSITTPDVQLVSAESFGLGELDPAIAVEITYVAGLEGSNTMILKRTDVKAIVEILLGMEIADEEFEMNELNESAICEVMNQMMCSSATALSDFLGYPVNISTPITYAVENAADFKQKVFKQEEQIVAINFKLSVEGSINSQFMGVFSVPFAKRIIAPFNLTTAEEVPEEANETVAEAAPQPITAEQSVPKAAPAPQPAPAPAPQSAAQKEKLPSNVLPAEQAARAVHVVPQSFDAPMQQLSEEQQGNLDLIMSVPLEVSVEIGRARRKIKEILEFTTGTLIELDKLAGEHVDVFVNGKCIAKGDVVVIDDTFGVRITEINKKDLLQI